MPFAAGLLCAKCITHAISNFVEAMLLYIIEGGMEAQRACILAQGHPATEQGAQV